MIRPAAPSPTASSRSGAQPPLKEILGLACRAPSVHNTQPWLWRLRDGRLELVADYSRQLKHADPDGRDLLLSCGAVLHHLQVTAAAMGWPARVRRLPDPGQPAQVATVTFSPATRPAHGAAVLRSVRARQTDRRRFTSWPVPSERLHSLAAAGAQWGAQVLPVGGESVRSRLRLLTARADHLQRQDPGYLSELESWVRSGRDGLTPEVLPSRASTAQQDDGLSRRFPSGTLVDTAPAYQAAADAMLLVCTRSDDPMSCIRAGEAMSAVWLRATEEQLAVVPLSQALEVEETRHEVMQSILGGLAHPQILLRTGWPPVGRAELPPTPRRPLSEVLVRDPA